MPDPGSTPQIPGWGRFAPWIMLAVALVLHGVQTARLFPSWDALIDDERPVIVVDHAIHLYHGALGARFAREHGTTWGYDPFFMAGYPETPVWDSSSNLSIAFQLAAGGRYSPRAYKLGLFACTWLTVALLAVGAWWAGLSPWEIAATAALATPVFWGTMSGVLLRSGLFSFIMASSASVAVFGLLLRYDQRPSRSRWALLTASGAALLFAHVTAPIVMLGPTLGYFVAAVRRWQSRRRRLAALAPAALVAAVVNAFWLVPLWRFRGLRSVTFSFLTADSVRAFWLFLLERPVQGWISLGLMIVGACGLAAWWREGRRTRAAVFGGGAALLLALCALGSLWSVTRSTEPIRFVATLDLMLTVPAASALVRLWAAVARWTGGGRRGGLVAATLAATIAAAAWFLPPYSLALLADLIAERRPLVVGLRPEDRELVRALREQTDSSARILFEDQLRLLEATDPESTHWTPLLPFLLAPDERTFIGGLYLMAFIQHNRAATFGDYSLGNRRIDTWNHDELRDYCRRYNIGWIVCWSPLSRFCIDAFPDAHPIATLPRAVSPQLAIMRDETQWRAIAAQAGGAIANNALREGVNHYRLYRVDRPHSFFLKGSGQVSHVDANLVELRDLTPDPSLGGATLSLHWLDTWRTDPSVPLTPVFLPGDPVPFVFLAFDRPIAKLSLRNGY